MAAIPIVGAVVGVASTVSQISNQNNQSAAQEQQIQAQQQALQIQGATQQANLQLQLNQLARQQTYANSESQIVNLQQAMQQQQDNQNIALQKLNVQNQQSSAIFGANAGMAQAQINASQQQQQAAGQLYATDSSANAQYAGQLQQGTQQLTELGNQGYQLNKKLANDEAMQGQVGLAMAAKQEGQTNLQDLGSNNPFNDVTSRNVLQSRQNQMLNALQNYQQRFGNVSGDVLHQLAYSKEFTGLLQQYGLQNFQDTLGNINRGLDFSTQQGNASIQAANSQAQLSQSSLDQAQLQTAESFNIQQAQSALNSSFYDASNQASALGLQATNAGSEAGINTQIQGLNYAQTAQPVGPLGYASAGLSTYNSASGLFNSPSSSTNQFSLINSDGSGGGVFGTPNYYGTYNNPGANVDYGFISGGLS